jgi:uncharacterized membrane protein (DUF485 family)
MEGRMANATQSSFPARTPGVGNDAPAVFGEIDRSAPGTPHADPDFVAIAESPEFHELRSRLYRFVFPMSAVFLAWYLAYVGTAAYLPGFMSIRLFGEINIGLLMGVGQFASTIVITALYLRFASRWIDPQVAELRRAELGGDDR